jgi:uncharacterized protein (TIGR02444 family)
MNPAPIEEFWQFTLVIYAKPGVSAACIALQDHDGRDVNLMLLALYAGLVLGRRLTVADFSDLEAASSGWRGRVTTPLRAVRRDLKAWSPDPQAAVLRSAVQAAEIEAERLAQRQLVTALPVGPVEAPGCDLARDNLRCYAGAAADSLAAAAIGAIAADAVRPSRPSA